MATETDGVELLHNSPHLRRFGWAARGERMEVDDKLADIGRHCAQFDWSGDGRDEGQPKDAT